MIFNQYYKKRAIIQKLSDSATEFGGIAQLGERLNAIQADGALVLLIFSIVINTPHRITTVWGVYSM